jgi:DNA-binding PadR family transcriptional regulator
MAVLRGIAAGQRYGFEIIDRTGLPSGTVYPALSSLERRGLIVGQWEADAKARAAARPRRRYYRITAAGEAALTAGLRRLEALGLGAPASSGRLRGAEGR